MKNTFFILSLGALYLVSCASGSLRKPAQDCGPGYVSQTSLSGTEKICTEIAKVLVYTIEQGESCAPGFVGNIREVVNSEQLECQKVGSGLLGYRPFEGESCLSGFKSRMIDPKDHMPTSGSESPYMICTKW